MAQNTATMIALGFHYVYPICIRHKNADHYFIGIVEKEGDELRGCGSRAEYKYTLDVFFENNDYLKGADADKVKEFTMAARMHLKEEERKRKEQFSYVKQDKQSIWLHNF